MGKKCSNCNSLFKLAEELLVAARKQQETIERQELVLALLQITPPKKKRGRPPQPKAEKRPCGRPKTVKEFGYIEEIEEAKIKYGEKTNVGALRAMARDLFKSSGRRESLVNSAEIKSFIKTVENRLSEEKKRIKKSQKIAEK